jgi:hypothetical protein
LEREDQVEREGAHQTQPPGHPGLLQGTPRRAAVL